MDEQKRLFGTLLASKPARARSPLALTGAIILHVVVLGLLVLASRHFIPQIADNFFEPILIIPEEEAPIQIAPQPRAGPTDPKDLTDPKDPKDPREPAGGEITFVPGEVVGIPEAAPGPETVEPSDAGGTGTGAGSLAERLRAGVPDPRLNPGATYQLPGDLSPTAAVRARIAGTLQAWNDSVEAETEARRRALDWTIKTKDGKRWGINPDGTIQLGDIKLPQMAFKAPPGRRDEIAARNRDFAEIERQANSEIGRQSFNQRVKAIRARKEKEREEKKKAAEAAPPISER